MQKKTNKKDEILLDFLSIVKEKILFLKKHYVSISYSYVFDHC
jgi:hypothetical protein